MIIKCKMCGGDMDITENLTVFQCEYCGTNQTIPIIDNEKKLTLFERANRLRFNCEFDKAAGVYESIVAEYPTEAEAYWGLVLCRYGIEYVDDPATGKKSPPVTVLHLTVLWKTVILTRLAKMQMLQQETYTVRKLRLLSSFAAVFLKFQAKKSLMIFSFAIRKQTKMATAL